MVKEILIRGHTPETLKIINNSFLEAKKGITDLMLRRILNVAEIPQGVLLTIKDKRLASYLNKDDLINAIKKSFKEQKVKDLSFTIEPK